MTVQRHFGPWDYVVFALMVVMSAAIGIFYGCRGSKQKTTKEFLLANRKLSVVPVAISILVSTSTLPVELSLLLSACLYLFLCLSLYLYVSVSPSLFLCVYICFSAFLFTFCLCLSLPLSVCLYLFLCLSLFLFVSVSPSLSLTTSLCPFLPHPPLSTAMHSVLPSAASILSLILSVVTCFDVTRCPSRRPS